MKDNPIYALTREILDAHGYGGYERHHYRGKEMRKVIGLWNDVIGVGVQPLTKQQHDWAHTVAGKKAPLDYLSAEKRDDIFVMMNEQLSAIIARPELWPWIRGERK